MNLRGSSAFVVAWLLVARPSAASCEDLAWDLRDVLRELVVSRLAQSEPISPRQVERVLRARGLPFPSPVFRFARGQDRARVAIGPQRGEVAPCEVSETFAEVEAPEGTVSAVAALRVEAGIESFAVEEDAMRWRVVARVREGLPLTGFELVVGARSGGGARRHAVQAAGNVLRAVVPRGALEGPVTMQLVAQTPTGPEVVAEGEVGLGPADPEKPASARSGIALPEGASLVDALNEARVRLGVPKLVVSAPLARVASETLEVAIARGLLVHRTEAGLVGDRLKDARISHRRAGELLARVSGRESAVERFFASPSHRSILGDGKLRSVGVAQAKGPDGLNWVVVVMATP